jgi:hypothetical protein
MEARLKLKPGQKGTKKLLEIYGDSLVCVRYRYDAVNRARIKTVEIIVEKKGWTPPPPRFADDAQVPVRIAFAESGLKTMAREAGGRWNPEARLWFVPYGKIKNTALKKHTVVDASPSSDK